MPESGIPLFKHPPTLYKQVKSSFLRFLNRFKSRKQKSYKGSKKRRSVFTERAGRNIRIVKYKKEENTIAGLASLVNSIFNGKYDLGRRCFSIDIHDLVGWKHLERESITLVLLVDLSHSTYSFVNMFAEIINSLATYFQMHNDRIGLISLQGKLAQVLNHPTHNYRVIVRNLTALKIHGHTPIADGLIKALTMVRLERFRKPGSRSLVLLISDCFPEPLVGGYDNIFDEPVYREAIRAAALYKKTSTQLLIINPLFRKGKEGPSLAGERLSEILANESKGRLIKIYRDEMVSDKATMELPSRGEIRQILTGIESMLGSRPSEDALVRKI